MTRTAVATSMARPATDIASRRASQAVSAAQAFGR